MINHKTFVYGHGATEDRPVPLEADIYYTNSPTPRGTLVWLHSGGFTSGTHRSLHHKKLAQELVKQGYNAVFPSYRLRRHRPVTTAKWKTIHTLDSEVAALNEGVKRHFTRRLALAAMEDTVALLDWIRSKGDIHNLDDTVCLGGSSAGGITVLNTLYLSHLSGRPAPKNISSAFVASGAFVYSSHHANKRVQVMALHNPNDTRVPIAPILRLASADNTQVNLIKTTSQHGSWGAYDDEPIEDAVSRIVLHDQSSFRG